LISVMTMLLKLLSMHSLLMIPFEYMSGVLSIFFLISLMLSSVFCPAIYYYFSVSVVTEKSLLNFHFQLHFFYDDENFFFILCLHFYTFFNGKSFSFVFLPCLATLCLLYTTAVLLYLYVWQ
jgi:hypothetical protein